MKIPQYSWISFLLPNFFILRIFEGFAYGWQLASCGFDIGVNIKPQFFVIEDDGLNMKNRNWTFRPTKFDNDIDAVDEFAGIMKNETLTAVS